MNHRDDRRPIHPGNPGFDRDERGFAPPEDAHYGSGRGWREPGAQGQYEREPESHYRDEHYGREFERGGRDSGRADVRRGWEGERRGDSRYAGGRPEERFGLDPYGRDRLSQEYRQGFGRRSLGESGRRYSGESHNTGGYSSFAHPRLRDRDEPQYFGTGWQGYGGGPSFTGGSYGYANERSDSPYFDEVGFNRGYDEQAGRPGGGQYGGQGQFGGQSQYGGRYGGQPYGGQHRGQRHEEFRHGTRYPSGPKGYQRSDERLREDISERLMQSHDIDSSEVTVHVLGGKVVLEGTVPARFMKHAIEDLADSAPGVQDVDNRIRVVGRGGGFASTESATSGSTTGGSTAGGPSATTPAASGVSTGSAATGSVSAGATAGSNATRSGRRDS